MRRWRVIDANGTEIWRKDISPSTVGFAEAMAIEYRILDKHNPDPVGTRYVIRTLRGPA